MAKKRMNGIGSSASELLPMLAGFVVGQIATKQLNFLSTNPQTGALIKVGAGLFLADKSGFIGGLAKGVAIEGAASFVMPQLQQAGIAFLNPGAPARLLAGVPGNIETNGQLGF